MPPRTYASVAAIGAKARSYATIKNKTKLHFNTFTETEIDDAVVVARNTFQLISSAELKLFLTQPIHVFSKESMYVMRTYSNEFPWYVDADIKEYDLNSHQPQIDIILRWLWLDPRRHSMARSVTCDENNIRSFTCIMHAFARNGLQGFRLQRAFVTSAARIPVICMAILQLSKQNVFHPPLDIHAPFQHLTALYLATLNMNTTLIGMLLEDDSWIVNTDTVVQRRWKPSVSSFCTEKSEKKKTWAALVSGRTKANENDSDDSDGGLQEYDLHHVQELKWIHSLNRPCCHHGSDSSALPHKFLKISKEHQELPLGLAINADFSDKNVETILKLLSTYDDNADCYNEHSLSLDREMIEWRSDYDDHTHDEDDDVYWGDRMYNGIETKPFITTFRRRICEMVCEMFTEFPHEVNKCWPTIQSALQTIRNKALDSRSKTLVFITSNVMRGIEPLSRVICGYAFVLLPGVTLEFPSIITTEFVRRYNHVFVPVLTGERPAVVT